MTNGGKFWQFFRPVGAFFRVSLSLACRWPLVPPRNEVNPIADLEGLGKNSLLRIMERGALGVRIKSDFPFSSYHSYCISILSIFPSLCSNL